MGQSITISLRIVTIVYLQKPFTDCADKVGFNKNLYIKKKHLFIQNNEKIETIHII